MASPSMLPIKFLADNAPTVVATVGGTERLLQLDVICANVLVRCVTDDAKCPKTCGPNTEIIHYSSYHTFNSVCVQSVNNTACVHQGILNHQELPRRPGRRRRGQLGRSRHGLTASLVLAPDTREYDGVFSNKLRMSGSTSDSVFSSQLSSFSLSLGATPADGGSVILNGADDDRITKEKLTGYKVPLDSGRRLQSQTQQRLGERSRGKPSTIWTRTSSTRPSTRCTCPARRFTKLLDDLSCTSTYENSKSVYACDASKPFPPIGLTFGDSTFYLTKEYYTTPHPTQVGRVVLKVASSYKVARLGLPFLRAFPVQIFPGSSVTVYCKEGKSCAKGVIPKAPPTSAPPRRTAATHAPSEGVNMDNGDSADNSATLASTMHNVGFAHAIVSTIVLVLLIIAGIVRKQKNSSKTAVNAASADSNAADPAIVLTPQASSTTFIDAKTPKP
ncbi:hypothetical protein PINS_up021250 [Pythium insidiosum]|nr:hypothetical protein PINS_up021250 [Pythium insidiosum]